MSESKKPKCRSCEDIRKRRISSAIDGVKVLGSMYRREPGDPRLLSNVVRVKTKPDE